MHNCSIGNSRVFSSWNMTVADEDKEVVKQCLRDEIELTVDEFDRVWTEGGMYIADAVDAPENGIGFEVQISNAASALGKKGGASKSPAKVAAVRENGKKGGRPKRSE